MKFVFGKQDMSTLERAQERCWLLTNGLGGYMSATAAFSATRLDHSILMEAVTAPTVRYNLVHRLQEKLTAGECEEFLSTQVFAGGQPPEEGYRHLSSFLWENGPMWCYQLSGIQVRRRCVMEREANTSAVLYEIENRSGKPYALRVRPSVLFTPKGEALTDTIHR